MPELPEVETIREGLRRHVSGRVIRSVQIFHPRVARRHQAGPADLAERLRGAEVGDVRRRGKFLWLAVREEALIAHLGMSGQLLIGDPARPFSAHVRARFAFADGGPDLRFVDQRTFGYLACERRGAGLPLALAHIAPDPLDPVFDPEWFAGRVRRRRTGIKRALLDQTLISGIGNIYADESLWRVGLHGTRAADRLRKAEVGRLVGAVRDVFADAIAAGGTSFDSLYVHVNGESGYFDRALAVYGRAGEPCPRCGTPVRREKFMNRSSFSCPACQPRPRGGR